MPFYRGVLSLEDEGPDTPVVHLFDYSSEGDKGTSKSNYRKQIIAVESCIYLGRRNLATIRNHSQSQGRRAATDSQSANSPENNPEKAANDSAGSGADFEEAQDMEGVKEERKEEEEEEEEEEGRKAVKESFLKEGREFQGYILKCPNGPYDYATKLWDTGRAAPPEAGYPKEGEEVAALVVDRGEDVLTVACGPNVAFARRKTFLCAGVDPDDLSLPFARLKVSLRRLQEREALVPAAGWEASPTQVVVPPYDVY